MTAIDDYAPDALRRGWSHPVGRELLEHALDEAGVSRVTAVRLAAYPSADAAAAWFRGEGNDSF